MHPLDIGFLTLVAAWPLARAWDLHRMKPVAMGFALLVVIGLPVYLALDLMRWPMVPALVLFIWWETQAVSVIVGDTPPAVPRPRDRLVPLALAAALFVPAAALPTLLLPRIPAFHPTGPFLVGVDDRVWPDSVAVADGAGAAVVPMRLWFPAEPVPQPSRARRHRETDLLERDLARLLPGPDQRWVVRGLTRSPLALTREARLSTRQREYPVVVLSHGYPGSPALLATLATELASHGFVVVSPEHAGGALGMRVPDDTHVPSTAESFGATAPAAWPAQVGADLRATRQALAVLNTAGAGGRYTGRLRLGEVAWIAEGASAEAVPDDADRLTLTVSLADGYLIDRGGDDTTRVEIDGARAVDLTDLAWWSPRLLRRAGLGGYVKPRQVQAVVHRTVLAALRGWLGG